MENHDAVIISGEPVPRLEEVIRVDSDSESESDSRTVSDVGGYPDPDHDGDSAASEVSGMELDPFGDTQLVRVNHGDEQDRFVKSRFLNEMSRLGMRTTVEAVYKNVYPGFTWQAKLRSFQEISGNMEKAGEGLGKVTYAWFSGSKGEINNIFRHGFGTSGRGICLTPLDNPRPSLRGCVADADGLCHLILCRTILGRSELLTTNPQQRFPKSEEFHSAVDNMASPKLYMVWSSYMNTHIMPQYVVSFRPPLNANGAAFVLPAPVKSPVRPKERVAVAKAATSGPVRPPRTIPFSILINELEGVLTPTTISSLRKSFIELLEGKTTKRDLTQKLRRLAGDDLLFRTITSMRRRQGASGEAAPGGSKNAIAAQRKSGARTSANRVLKKLHGAKK